MVDFEHPAGESLFWRISDAMERLVEQLEQHSPAELFFQKVNRDIAQAEAEEATMPHADQKAREDYIHRLSEAVDRAFNERDRLWAANGYDCPKAARQEEIAVALLDRFNAEVEVDMAEVERRRAENLRKYHEERENQWIREKDAAGSWTETPRPAEPYRPPTTSNGGTTMSKVLDGQQLLLGVAQLIEDLGPAVSGDGDPEEMGQVQRAEQLEAEADQKMAAAHGAPTAAAMAAHAAEAEQLANQAEQLRQQAREGLEARVAHAKTNAETADQSRSMIREAVEGTRRGGEMTPAAGAIHNAIEESGTALAGAASAATERERTHECLGLIKQAQEAAATAAGLCGALCKDIEQYVGSL